jgi:hypothetical protein
MELDAFLVKKTFEDRTTELKNLIGFENKMKDFLFEADIFKDFLTEYEYNHYRETERLIRELLSTIQKRIGEIFFRIKYIRE